MTKEELLEAREIIKQRVEANGTAFIEELNKCITPLGLLNLSLDECAIVLGITRQRVAQIERGALFKMKHPLVCGELREYIALPDTIDSNFTGEF